MRKSNETADGAGGIEHIAHIGQAFRQARSELGRVGSSRSEILRRVAATSIKNVPTVRLACTIAGAALLVLGTFVWWRARETARLPHSPLSVRAPAGAEEVRMEVGPVELDEYIAAVVDHRAVVVIWSYRGEGIAAEPATRSTGRAPGKYRSATLHERRLSNGKTFVCSLFVPAAGVRPILEPPAIGTRSNGTGVLSLSVSPRPASADELAGAIRSAGAGAEAGISAEAILQEAQRYLD